MTLLVRAATLTNYLLIARKYGLNTVPLLREAGLSRALIDNPDQMIPALAVSSLLEASAAAAKCDSFGLQMSEGRTIADFGPISLLIAHQPTLRDAVQTLIDFRHLINPSLAMKIEDFGEISVVREEVSVGGSHPPRQASELAMAVLMGVFRSILGADWWPDSVSFVHRRPASLEVHRKLLGERIEFETDASCLTCKSSDLNHANPQANSALALHARHLIASRVASEYAALADEVRQAIILLLPSGQASISTVAQALGRNVRTVQRHLEQDGLVFSAILDDVRRELALRYLDNPKFRSLHVAEMLGYANSASFTRWFVGQFGEPPSRYRRARQG